jgi:hypothetical protein
VQLRAPQTFVCFAYFVAQAKRSEFWHYNFRKLQPKFCTNARLLMSKPLCLILYSALAEANANTADISRS